MEENYSLERLQEEFASFLQSENKRESTIRQCCSILKSLLPERVHQEILEETASKPYYSNLIERLEQEIYGNPKHTTRRNSFTLMNTFTRFLNETGRISSKKYYALPKEEKKLFVFMTEKEYKRLIKTIIEDPFSDVLGKYKNARDLLIVALMRDTGITLSELANLEWDNLDLRRGYIRIAYEKNKERKLPLGSSSAKYITDYTKLCNKHFNKEGKLFRSENNDRINPRSIRRRFKQYAKKAGLGRWEILDSTSLRYAFARDRIRKGAGIKELCELLGIKEVRAREMINLSKFITT